VSPEEAAAIRIALDLLGRIALALERIEETIFEGRVSAEVAKEVRAAHAAAAMDREGIETIARG
jgi:hypothetical protein